MTDEQFVLLLEKLEWIGCILEELVTQGREHHDYPRDVRIVPNRKGY